MIKVWSGYILFLKKIEYLFYLINMRLKSFKYSYLISVLITPNIKSPNVFYEYSIYQVNLLIKYLHQNVSIFYYF